MRDQSWNSGDGGTTIDHGGSPMVITLPNGRLVCNSALSVLDGAGADGAQIVQRPCTGALDQQWRLAFRVS